MNAFRISFATTFATIALQLALSGQASAQLWEDATAATIGTTGNWTNKVELADLNGDGMVDLLFANGGDYDKRGLKEPSQVFLNQGPGLPFAEASQQILDGQEGYSRVIKARDLNRDGFVDLVVGGAYQSQTRLYLGLGAGAFTERSDLLPQGPTSIGDLEIGDINNDGILDLVLADWGEGNPFVSEEGRILVWRGLGDGSFDDFSESLSQSMVQWSWDMELVDTDNDFDLDIVASCKVCPGSKLFINEGGGEFSDQSQRMPQFTNNYEFEPIDINNDGFVDLITINDGEALSNEFDRREHIFVGDGTGGFRFDEAEHQAIWPDEANLGADDNSVAVFDFDSDGDPDFLIGALFDAPDRLLENDMGTLVLHDDVFSGSSTQGTLSVAVADLNGDGKLDVVQAQGEAASDERVYFGKDIAVDSAEPLILGAHRLTEVGDLVVRARIHDNKSPVADFDFQSVQVSFVSDGAEKSTEMHWYGGSLWEARTLPSDASDIKICAVDAVGNSTCSDVVAEPDSCDSCDGDGLHDDNLGGCNSGKGRSSFAGLLLFFLLAIKRRKLVGN